MDKQIVVYNGADDVRLEVQTDGETVWLTQAVGYLEDSQTYLKCL